MCHITRNTFGISGLKASFLKNTNKTIPSYFEMRATLSYVFTIITPEKKT